MLGNLFSCGVDRVRTFGRCIMTSQARSLDKPSYSRTTTFVFAGMANIIFMTSCEANPYENVDASRALTGREIHEIQSLTQMETSQIVETGADQYAIPRASYVRLGEVGRGTSTSYYQAWINLKPAVPPRQYTDQKYLQRKLITASVSFSENGAVSIPVPGEGWKRSEAGIPEFPEVELWLDTEQCVDDRPPQAGGEQYDLRIGAIWTFSETPLYLSCRATIGTPSGRHSMNCVGGSPSMPSGLRYRFYGVETLDMGCRASLENLVRSYVYLPLIVSDWKKNSR